MSALLFLTSEDFEVRSGPKGPILTSGVKGFNLIMFYSDSCGICKTKSIPMIRRLPGTINGCQFSLAKVDSKLIEMSRATIKPLTYVPCMILYYDSKPFMEYRDTGNYDPNDVRKFIIDVSSNLQARQQFSSGQQQGQPAGAQQQQNPNAVPDDLRKEYSLGVPIYGDMKGPVCYLSWDQAYNPKNGTPQQRGNVNANMR